MGYVDDRPIEDAAQGLPSTVVVKFRGGTDLPYTDAANAQVRRSNRRGWQQIDRRFAGLTLRPFFAEAKEDRLRNLSATANRARRQSQVDLTSYFAIDIPAGMDADAVAEAIRTMPEVETAYVQLPPPPPPVNDSDDPRASNQGYLDAAPTGIDARWMWSRATGDGVGIVDIEQSWTLNHEDLVDANVTLVSGVSKGTGSHGTAVLGELVAVDNTIGNVGIAPDAAARVISIWRTNTYHNIAEAIVSATDNMVAGDVLLLEAQERYTGYGDNYLPVEVLPATFDVIAAAVASGIIVVEAAGNGSNDLDAFTDIAGLHPLSRTSPDFKDSGAIMVGAASSGLPHTRLDFSNYGSRIDCYGWGRNVDTCGGTGGGTTDYTTNFGGTSSASPIVAGAALLLQSWRMNFGGALNPAAMRNVLSDPMLGTTSGNPASDRIGVMPDLKAIVRSFEKPFDPNRWLAIIYILFGVVEGGGGVGWRPGGPPIPIDPRGPLFDHLAPEKRDILVALAMTELAGLVEDGDARTSMNKAALSAMQAAIEKLGRQI